MMRFATVRLTSGLLALFLAVTSGTGAHAQDTAWNAAAWNAEDQKRWNDLQKMFFQDRPIGDGSAVLALEAPTRAHDAALVPVTVTTLQPDQPIRAIHLMVDANPVPLAGVFRFGAAAASASISTRVRVNEYTPIHAVAEMADGGLLAVSRYVKAAGGCSAPALKDPQQALARLGKMKLNLPETVTAGKPVTAQLLISHPNNSGMQFDQISRTYIPAHFVRTLTIRYDGQPVLTLDGDISLSEDPSIHFSFVPKTSGTLTTEVVDSKDMVFKAAWPVTAAPAS